MGPSYAPVAGLLLACSVGKRKKKEGKEEKRLPAGKGGNGRRGSRRVMEPRRGGRQTAPMFPRQEACQGCSIVLWRLERQTGVVREIHKPFHLQVLYFVPRVVRCTDACNYAQRREMPKTRLRKFRAGWVDKTLLVQSLELESLSRGSRPSQQ